MYLQSPGIETISSRGTGHDDLHTASIMASIFQTMPALRRAAPILSRRFFTCSQCLKGPSAQHASSLRASQKSSILRAVRYHSTRRAPSIRKSSTASALASSPLEALSKSIGGKATGSRASFFPEISEKVVAYWLLGSAASVFGIVVFGGLTRLTESGYVKTSLEVC